MCVCVCMGKTRKDKITSHCGIVYSSFDIFFSINEVNSQCYTKMRSDCLQTVRRASFSFCGSFVRPFGPSDLTRSPS